MSHCTATPFLTLLPETRTHVENGVTCTMESFPGTGHAVLYPLDEPGANTLAGCNGTTMTGHPVRDDHRAWSSLARQGGEAARYSFKTPQ